MAMEVTPVLRGTQQAGRSSADMVSQRRVAAEAQLQAQQQRQRLTREQIQRYTNELQQVSQALNKRLSFNYNEELEVMVVKVIDGNTDKVIKELPPRELQRVHMRIREAIGLLLDESV
jgi:flagellar protein FlaG